MRVLPRGEEVPALMPGPGSITWYRAADARTLLAAGYALVLQVAHPTIGAGVDQHSTYRQDPWGRLLRTLDFINGVIYADPATAARVARGVRYRHRRIRGVRADGSRYHALEPGAYAWVWATLFSSIVAAHARFGSPMHRDEQERFWEEWRLLGRLLGVRDRDLPVGLAAYEGYFQEMVQDVLEDSDSVRAVIEAISKPARPSLPRYAQPLWALVRFPAAHALRLATTGMLPRVLRERLRLSWTLADELELRTLGVASRAATPLISRHVRLLGPVYLRLRYNEEGQRRVTRR